MIYTKTVSDSDNESKTIIDFDLENECISINRYDSDDVLINWIKLDEFEIEALWDLLDGLDRMEE